MTFTQPLSFTRLQCGLLLIDKPAGMSSHDVVICVRKQLGIRQVGHAGTLDPFATGLLLLLIGPATKMQMSFMKQDKTYRVQFYLGKQTDTFDVTGEVTMDENSSPGSLVRARSLCLQEIKTVVQRSFIGDIDQIPPRYSAVKIHGKRAYILARKGEQFELPSRRICIKLFEVLDYHNNHLEAIIHCSSGTYIRSIARDLGLILGTGAFVTSLCRLSIGDTFSVTEAHSVHSCSEKQIIPLQKALSSKEVLHQVEVPFETVQEIFYGRMDGINRLLEEKSSSFGEMKKRGRYVLVLYEGELAYVLKYEPQRGLRMCVNMAAKSFVAE